MDKEQDVMSQVEDILNAEAASVEDIDVDTSRQGEGDVPNAEYRLRAAQRQQRKAEELAKNKLSAVEAKMELILQKLSGEQNDPEPDDLLGTVKSLQAELNRLKQEREQEKFQQRDRTFFSNHPELDRVEVSEALTDFLGTRPTMAKALVSGEIDIEDVYVQYVNKTQSKTPKSAVQDSSKVFGRSEPQSPRGRVTSKSKEERANEILRNPDSTNKREAVKLLEESLFEKTLQQLRS